MITNFGVLPRRSRNALALVRIRSRSAWVVPHSFFGYWICWSGPQPTQGRCRDCGGTGLRPVGCHQPAEKPLFHHRVEIGALSVEPSAHAVTRLTGGDGVAVELGVRFPSISPLRAVIRVRNWLKASVTSATAWLTRWSYQHWRLEPRRRCDLDSWHPAARCWRQPCLISCSPGRR